MIEILFSGVKSDVRSPQNRLNTNWPQTRQDFSVDDYSFVEEIVIRTLFNSRYTGWVKSILMRKKCTLTKKEARTALFIPSRFNWFDQAVDKDLLFFHCLYFT